MPGPQPCAATRYCFTHPVSPRIVGSGLDRSACPFPSLRRGGIYAARNLPTACRQSSTAHKSLHPHQTIPTTRIHTTHLTLHLVVIQPSCTHIHLAQTSPSNFVEKIKKTCKNLLTKVILLAIIIKLSREPSPRRQPLKPIPTACTPFFEENFFKKLSENLLTNERI